LGRNSITAEAALPVPDFAFEWNGRQQTLTRLLKRGPVLMILFSPPAPAARLAQLAAARQRLGAAGLTVVAVNLGESPAAPAGNTSAPPFVVSAASDDLASLRLFAPDERGRTSELLLDRAGNVRARWASDGPGGLADPGALAAAAEGVARFPAAAPSHAGHAG
jgi:hypothetical protein